MKMKVITVITLTCCALCLLSIEASADRENPGSCLLFPYYDSADIGLTIITISNTGAKSIDVRIVWVDESNCSPDDVWIKLTGYDTFTFTSKSLTPYKSSGFIYAYVVDQSFSKKEIDADVLIGQEIVISNWDGHIVNFSLNAVAFQCLDNPNQDGMIQLDGTEYSAAPKTLYFPRFFGHNYFFNSRIVMINLTGGQYFTAQLEWLVYNDNEVVFSMTDKIDCHEIKTLTDVSPIFSNTFLQSTSHDPSEPQGFSTFVETGTFQITGRKAWNDNNSVQIDNPSVYAVLIEGIGNFGFGTADLPMQVEDPKVYNHGMLWSTSPDGK
jgi:hypothetical protein